MRGRINAINILYLTDYDMVVFLLYICFMGVDYTHMQSYLIHGLMRLYCMFEFVVRESRFAEWSLQWHHMSFMAAQISVPFTVCWTVCTGWQQKKNPNSLTWNVIFITNYSRIYKITHSDLWVCHSRNRVLQQCLYGDATWAWWRPKPPTVWQFAQQHVLDESKRKSNWRRNQL